ncbi:MAG: TolC family protein, partial [Proteobacteria bacterium]|nr:TolC family protein [Pseudomonadota bacterium]
MKLSIPFTRKFARVTALLSIALFSLSVSAFAKEAEVISPAAPTSSPTLVELIDVGLSENPSIKAMRAALHGVEQRYSSARAFDDPTLSYTQPISEVETRLGPNKRSIALSQKLPYPGKLRLKGKLARKDTELAGINLESAVRDLVAEIKSSYYEIYYLDMAANLSRERIKVLEHFTKAEMNDYSVGVAGLSEVVSAETRFADAEYDLVLFEELRRAETSRLNAL